MAEGYEHSEEKAHLEAVSYTHLHQYPVPPGAFHEGSDVCHACGLRAL